MPYSSEEIIEPFWAEYSAEASGRDPLAIQNSSVVIYAKMIVGITNVTNRIRYNGFYCWILNLITKEIEKRNSLDEQIKYLRRAELLLAYIMVKNYPNITGVSGSAFAARNIQPNIILKAGADLDKTKTKGKGLYWKFDLGIFGQYYSGAVRDLNLINHPQGDLKIYTTTGAGKVLGEAYQANIPNLKKELFWNSVLKGHVKESDLETLTSFALHLIPETSAENEFYKNMLLSKDDRKFASTYHRKETIELLLKYLMEEKQAVKELPISFLRHNYKRKYTLPDIRPETSTAWYLFEINELVHVAFEHFHACFLYSLEYYPTEINNTLDGILNDISNAFKNSNIDTKKTSIKQHFDGLNEKGLSVYQYYDEMESAFKQGNYGLCLLNAINTILTVFSNCKNHLAGLKNFAEMNEYNFNRSGYAIDLFGDLLESRWEESVYEYSKSIVKLAINEHMYSSYGKTKIGQALVHNYMIEDNTAWMLRETLPGRTSPRLQNVIQFLTDIGWLTKIDNSFKISSLGMSIITK